MQATLNVIISILSTLCMFIFVRLCWQRGARHVARERSAPLESLLSINTLGEVFDTFLLFGTRLVSFHHGSTLAQCAVIVIFSITAIVSGPIARFSTQRGRIIREQDVTGLLATRFHGGIDNANVGWNLTHSRLNQADFPLNQLLDYLPDNSVNWAYDASQWNSSWTLECELFPQTSVALETVGNCTQDLVDEVPSLDAVFDWSKYDYRRGIWSAFQVNPVLKDVLLFMTAVSESNYSESEDTYRSMSVMIASIYMHNVPINEDSDTTCSFGVGRSERSSYTKIECSVRRRDSVPDAFNLAFPDIRFGYERSLPTALSAYYTARHIQESTSDEPITIISPEELIRFYQTYTVTKDTQYRHPVTRRLSVELQVVQISTIFLTIAALAALLITLGLAYHALFILLHFETVRTVPQSKIDWIIQSIHHAEARDHLPPFTTTTSHHDYSVTLHPSQATGPIPNGRRQQFAAAAYGRATSTRQLPPSTAHGAIPDLGGGLSPQFSPAGNDNSNKTPLLAQRSVSPSVMVERRLG